MWLTRLYRRFRELVHEMGKFGVVGTVAYAVDTGVFVLLVLTMESLVAKTIATVIAATVAFVGNRFWTWRDRARSGLTREYVLYFTFNGVGLGISLAILGASHYGLGSIWPAFQTPVADVIAANVIGLAAATVFRFWSYRTYVFREFAADPASSAGSPPPAPADGGGEHSGHMESRATPPAPARPTSPATAASQQPESRRVT